MGAVEHKQRGKKGRREREGKGWGMLDEGQSEGRWAPTAHLGFQLETMQGCFLSMPSLTSRVTRRNSQALSC